MLGREDLNVVNPAIVAGLVCAAILLIGPANLVSTDGKRITKGLDLFDPCPIFNTLIVNEELENIEAAAFAKAHEIELEYFAALGCFDGGFYARFRVANTHVCTSGAILVDFPRIITIRHKCQRAAGNIKSLIEGLSVIRLHGNCGTGVHFGSLVIRVFCKDRNGDKR